MHTLHTHTEDAPTHTDTHTSKHTPQTVLFERMLGGIFQGTCTQTRTDMYGIHKSAQKDMHTQASTHPHTRTSHIKVPAHSYAISFSQGPTDLHAGTL